MTATTPSPNACPRDSGTAYALNGSTSSVSTPRSYANPTTFSEEVWFRTTVAGGMLIGFGSSQTGASSQHDRKLYLTTTGQLAFGSYNGATQVITSPTAVNDGAWHHTVATMSPTNGMRLYVDGRSSRRTRPSRAPRTSPGTSASATTSSADGRVPRTTRTSPARCGTPPCTARN